VSAPAPGAVGACAAGIVSAFHSVCDGVGALAAGAGLAIRVLSACAALALLFFFGGNGRALALRALADAGGIIFFAAQALALFQKFAGGLAAGVLIVLAA